jgi:hypothetical protein
MEITRNEKDKREVPMKKNGNERGQSLVIIAIAFLALVAMVALIIDGGSLYLNRRNAQTAADAAALAGAHELCVNKGSDSAIQDVVDQYAITENGATAVENVDIDRTNKAVVVQTMLETSSFFAGVLGYENNTVRAEASAGCFPPSSSAHLLPIAWACQPPVGGSTDACTIHSIPWELFKNEILPAYGSRLHKNGDLMLDEGNEVTSGSYVDAAPTNPSTGKPSTIAYLVMDDNTFNTAQCAPPIGSGTLICDFNGDGILDLTGGGDRGWLAMDGSNGASTLVDILVTGYPVEMSLPRWFPDNPGAKKNAFIKAENVIEDDIALAPVYNAYCLSTTAAALPGRADCAYQAGDLITSGPGSPTYVRVAGFAPFIVTCVSANPGDKCPVKKSAGLDNNTPSFEGYFVSGYTAGTGIDPNGFDLGTYVISLTK